MNNAYVARLMAMGVAMTTFLAPAVAHADVVISDETSMGSQKVSGVSVTLEDGKPADLSNPGGTDVSDGPKITVKQDKFLLEKGAPFDLKRSLGLSVVDAKDGDITHEFNFNPIDTSQARSFTKVIKAENSDHKKSTKTLVFRIVGVESSIDIESVEALQTMDLSKIISGDTEGLTVKLGAIKDGSFIAKISDGTNTMEKEIKYNVKQGSTGKPSNPTDQTQQPGTNTQLGDPTAQNGNGTATPNPGANGSTTTDGTTTSTDALPQTGVASTTASIAAGLAAISGFVLKKKGN